MGKNETQGFDQNPVCDRENGSKYRERKLVEKVLF